MYCGFLLSWLAVFSLAASHCLMEPGKSFGETIPIIWHDKKYHLSTILSILNFIPVFLTLIDDQNLGLFLVRKERLAVVVVVVADLTIRSILKQMNSLRKSNRRVSTRNTYSISINFYVLISVLLASSQTMSMYVLGSRQRSMSLPRSIPVVTAVDHKSKHILQTYLKFCNMSIKFFIKPL